MDERVKFDAASAVAVLARGGAEESVQPHGRFHFEIVRDGVVVDAWDDDNTVMLAGRDSMLNVYFGAATQLTAWYVGLIDNAGFSAISSSDTAASHSGWSESSAYSQSVRQTYTPSASSGQSINNGASAATFTVNAPTTFNGAFLISNSTKGGTTGTLWCAASFVSNRSLLSGDTLRVTYTING